MPAHAIRCPSCSTILERPTDGERVVCPGCGRKLRFRRAPPSTPETAGGGVAPPVTATDGANQLTFLGEAVETNPAVVMTTSTGTGHLSMEAARSLWAADVDSEDSEGCSLRQGGTGRIIAEAQIAASVTLPVREVRAQNAPEPGGDLQLADTIGRGGMGVIYAARQRSLNRRVAVKVILPDQADRPGASDKFISEAVVTGALDHPNIVPIIELARNTDGSLFYAMKEVKGRAWSQVIGKKSLEENLDILLDVCNAISFAHDRGVLHRDLKPENVMVGDYGEVLVMDWGLAVAYLPEAATIAERLTPRNARGGTPAYMAPEMATGDTNAIGPCSDIYLLGGLLYELVTGLRPHHGANVFACIFAAMEGKIQPTTRRNELVTIAQKALARRPEDRYGSVKEFVEVLREYRVHRESIEMANQAAQLLREAGDNDYDRLSRALFGFEEATRLWGRNGNALTGIARARLRYAQAALGRGDHELAAATIKPLTTTALEKDLDRDGLTPTDRSLLTARNKLWSAAAAEADALALRVEDKQLRHTTQLRRARTLQWVSGALASGMLLFCSIGFLFYRAKDTERTRLENARLKAEARQMDLTLEKQMAEERARAEEQKRLEQQELAAAEKAETARAHEELIAKLQEKQDDPEARAQLAQLEKERDEAIATANRRQRELEKAAQKQTTAQTAPAETVQRLDQSRRRLYLTAFPDYLEDFNYLELRNGVEEQASTITKVAWEDRRWKHLADNPHENWNLPPLVETAATPDGKLEVLTCATPAIALRRVKDHHVRIFRTHDGAIRSRPIWSADGKHFVVSRNHPASALALFPSHGPTPSFKGLTPGIEVWNAEGQRLSTFDLDASQQVESAHWTSWLSDDASRVAVWGSAPPGPNLPSQVVVVIYNAATGAPLERLQVTGGVMREDRQSGRLLLRDAKSHQPAIFQLPNLQRQTVLDPQSLGMAGPLFAISGSLAPGKENRYLTAIFNANPATQQKTDEANRPLQYVVALWDQQTNKWRGEAAFAFRPNQVVTAADGGGYAVFGYLNVKSSQKTGSQSTVNLCRVVAISRSGAGSVVRKWNDQYVTTVYSAAMQKSDAGRLLVAEAKTSNLIWLDPGKGQAVAFKGSDTASPSSARRELGVPFPEWLTNATNAQKMAMSRQTFSLLPALPGVRGREPLPVIRLDTQSPSRAVGVIAPEAIIYNTTGNMIRQLAWWNAEGRQFIYTMSEKSTLLDFAVQAGGKCLGLLYHNRLVLANGNHPGDPYGMSNRIALGKADLPPDSPDAAARCAALPDGNWLILTRSGDLYRYNAKGSKKRWSTRRAVSTFLVTADGTILLAMTDGSVLTGVYRKSDVEPDFTTLSAPALDHRLPVVELVASGGAVACSRSNGAVDVWPAPDAATPLRLDEFVIRPQTRALPAAQAGAAARETSYLALGDGGRRLFTVIFPPEPAAAHPPGYTSREPVAVTVWDVESGQMMHRELCAPRQNRSTMSGEFLPDANNVAIAFDERDHSFWIFSLAPENLQRGYNPHEALWALQQRASADPAAFGHTAPSESVAESTFGNFTVFLLRACLQAASRRSAAP